MLQAGLSLTPGSGDVTKKLLFHQNASSSISVLPTSPPATPKHHTLSLVLSVPSFTAILKFPFIFFHKSMASISASSLSSDSGSGLCCWVPGLCEQVWDFYSGSHLLNESQSTALRTPRMGILSPYCSVALRVLYPAMD